MPLFRGGEEGTEVGTDVARAARPGIFRGKAGRGRNLAVAPEKALTGLPMTWPEAVRTSQKVPGAFSATSPWSRPWLSESRALSIPGWTSSSCWSIWL